MSICLRRGAASGVIVPVSIKPHLTTVPEKAFIAINDDAPPREEPLQYHAAPFHSNSYFGRSDTDENEPFSLRVLSAHLSIFESSTTLEGVCASLFEHLSYARRRLYSHGFFPFCSYRTLEGVCAVMGFFPLCSFRTLEGVCAAMGFFPLLQLSEALSRCLCSVSKSMPFYETRSFLLNAVGKPLSKGRFFHEPKLPFENHEERTVGSLRLRPRHCDGVIQLPLDSCRLVKAPQGVKPFSIGKCRYLR